MGIETQTRIRAFDNIKLDQEYEERDHPIHGPSLFWKDVVIAREIVQQYDDGTAYKPADELEKAAPYAGPRWAISGRHPETGLLMDTDDVHGLFENPSFVKNLKDHGRTGRENNRGIKGDLWAFKNKMPPKTYEDLKNGKRQDVSIGFVFTADMTPGKVKDGPLKGQAYDYVQRDIFNDHLTFGINTGRCPMPLCGVGADSAIPMSVTENAKRLLSFKVDRGVMAQVETDLSLPDINKKIKELKDQLDDKRAEINKLYGEVQALYDEAEDKSRPIYSKIDKMWADWDEIYDELRAYREAKILLLTKEATDKSGEEETDEAKIVRTMEHFGFKEEEWDEQPEEVRKVLLDKAPTLETEPCIEKTRVALADMLIGAEEGSEEKIIGVLETGISFDEEGAPILANDITKKLTEASICWNCLDTYDPENIPDDEPKDTDKDDEPEEIEVDIIEVTYAETERAKHLLKDNRLNTAPTTNK